MTCPRRYPVAGCLSSLPQASGWTKSKGTAADVIVTPTFQRLVWVSIELKAHFKEKLLAAHWPNLIHLFWVASFIKVATALGKKYP